MRSPQEKFFENLTTGVFSITLYEVWFYRNLDTGVKKMSTEGTKKSYPFGSSEEEDRRVLQTYRDSSLLHGILSSEGRKDVPAGTLCAFCSKQCGTACSLGKSAPAGPCDTFILREKDVSKVSAEIETTLVELFELQSQAA